MEAKTETKTDTGKETVTNNVETYVGTVTIYEPGKKIEVMTGVGAQWELRLALSR